MAIVLLVLLSELPPLSVHDTVGPPSGSTDRPVAERAPPATGVDSTTVAPVYRSGLAAGPDVASPPDCSRIGPADLLPLRPAERNWNSYCSNLYRPQLSMGLHGQPTGLAASGSYPQGFGIYNLLMTYDAYDGYVLLLGANGGSGRLNGTETWTFSGGSWSEVSSVASPQSCAGSVMAYDEWDGYAVYFGGTNLGAGSNCASAGETWTYRAGTWSQLHPPASPPARVGAAFTNDSADGYLLLFGGIGSSCSIVCNDSWTFVGGTWVELHPGNSPSNRSGAGMAYDATDGYVLLFGGSSYTGCTGPEQNGLYCMDRDTWAFSGGNWVQLNPIGPVPPEPYDDGLVYDAAAHRTFYTVTDDNRSTGAEIWWTFQGGNWTNPSTNGGYNPGLPRNRFGEGLAYDYRDGYPVMFGGTGIAWNRLVDTWGYINGSWANLTATGGFSAHLSLSSNATDVGVPVTLSTDVFGAPDSYTYVYTGLVGVCDGSSAPSFDCVPSTSGTFLVVVSVRNATGSYANASATLAVYDSPSITLFGANPPSVNLGSSTVLVVETSGGAPPLNYRYTDLPPGCQDFDINAFSCTPATAGVFHVTVTVFDAVGASATSTSALTVTFGSRFSSGTGPTWLEFGLGALSVGLAVALIAVIVTRRKTRPPPKP